MRILRVSTASFFVLSPAVAHAWNYKGHGVIASLAHRQLDEQIKRRIAEMLKKRPADAELWVNRPTNDPREPRRRYGRSQAHYLNYCIRTEQSFRVEPPLQGENILNSYAAHLKQIQNSRVSFEDKALHLSWVSHQAGDIHQPLHAGARFSKALPEGDRGGNEVHFPNPRARGGRPYNLHAYWDDLPGNDRSPRPWRSWLMT
jgi:hypothetical protein